MIGKQTGKQAEWKTQPAFSLVPRFMSMCCVFILAGDRFQQCLSWDQMPREMWGGGQSSGHTRPGRNLSVSEIPDSHTEPCLFVCFSIFILCSSSQQHPFLLSPAKSWDIPSSLFTRSLSLCCPPVIFVSSDSPCCFQLLCVSCRKWQEDRLCFIMKQISCCFIILS